MAFARIFAAFTYRMQIYKFKFSHHDAYNLIELRIIFMTAIHYSSFTQRRSGATTLKQKNIANKYVSCK